MSKHITSYSQTRTASKTTFLVLFCVCFVIFCGICYLCFYGLFDVKHCRQMIADGKTATAVIYNCGQDSGFGPNVWRCVYKYIDKDGTEYIGFLSQSYKTREEGEKHIGEEVEIYTDGKGKSFPVGEKPNVGYAVTWVVISVLLVCADMTGIVITCVKIHKERQNRVKSNRT